MKNRQIYATGLAVLAALAMPVYADEKVELEALRQTTATLIQTLVQSGIITQEKADEMLSAAKRSAEEAAAVQAKGDRVVRVPYVPQHVRDGIKEELRQEVMAQAKKEGWATPNTVPEWVSGLKWETDLRVRYQLDRFDKNNFSPAELALVEDPIDVNNSQDNRNRLRVRARFGVEMKVSDMTSLQLKLATGLNSDPISTNQTLGNNFNRYSINVDRALIKLDPVSWGSILAGRFANPFFSTDLVWDPDLSFDGIALAFKPEINENTKGFGAIGVFPLEELEPGPNSKAKSKWLYGAQAGVEWKREKTLIKTALGYYHYQHVEGIPNSGIAGLDPDASAFDGTAPKFRQKGNSLFDLNANTGGDEKLALASRFREVNLTSSVDFSHFYPLHVVLTGDIVKNVGFDAKEIARRTGRDIKARTLGYQGMITVGYPQIANRGEWNVFGAYKSLQRDAVLDAFTDSDFRLGGTDARGYILGGNYGIDKNTWLGLRWLSADPIDGPPLSVDVLQVDLNARF